MDNDGYVNEGIFDDVSVYRYLKLAERKDEKEEEEADEEWDNYFLDDSKLHLTRTVDEIKCEKISDSNLQKDSTVTELTAIEKRSNMISQLQKSHAEYKQLKLKNSYLHKKCRDVFIKSKIMNHLERWGFDADIHKDKRYIDILKEFKAIKWRLQEAENYYNHESETFENLYQRHFSEFRDAFQGLTSRELEIGAASVSGGTKEIAMTPVMDLLNKQKQRLDVLSQVRVKYLKLENLLKNIYAKMDDRNILGEGYTIIKYENLMMNKNMSLEKIDERENDLEKNQDQFLSIVHILAHVREVLVNVGGKIDEAETEFAHLEDSRQKKRIELREKNRQRELLNRQKISIKHHNKNRNL